MTTRKKTKVEEKRIYCVVASTVQILQTPSPEWASMRWLRVTQPLGRQVAQAAHAVSMARYLMFSNGVLRAVENTFKHKNGWKGLLETLKLLLTAPFTPITTIILEARDSFELQHVLNLLRKEEIPVYDFFDTEQPDYGDADSSVRTAIATEPVAKDAVEGILDYLPLWGSQFTK